MAPGVRPVMPAKIRNGFFAVLWCVVSGALLPVAAQAARLEKPYVVDVPVASQSTSDRAQASVAGLYQLLQRLTGRSQVDNPTVQLRVADGVERYILQFSYEKGNIEGGLFAPSAYRLRLVFSQNAVAQLLQEAGDPVWPLDRARVLWLVLDENNTHWPPGEDLVAQAALSELGQHHGLPLSVPILDLEDLELLDVSAIQSADFAALASAAERYQADAVLAAVFTGNDANGWRVRGALRFREDSIPVEASAPSRPEVLGKIMQVLAENLSAQFRGQAGADTGASTLQLRVSGVKGYSQYMRLQQMLNKLDVVKRMVVLKVEGSEVLFEVDVTGQDVFRELLVLSHLIAEDPVPVVVDTSQPAVSSSTPPVSTPGVAEVWRYHWIQ